MSADVTSPTAPAPGTVNGVDTYLACDDAIVSCLVKSGITFIGRYYFNLTKTVKQKFTAAEALRLSNAGLDLVAVYENKSDTYGYFSADKGTSDAQGALAQAQALGQPEGSAIYFTVDCDLPKAQVNANVVDYFEAVNEVIGETYDIGVYGSGLTCATMLDRKLALYAWLSCSMGWTGSKQFAEWHIRQSDPTKLCGLDIDPDIALPGAFGAFRVESVTTAAP
jgi:hypothetical protein